MEEKETPFSDMNETPSNDVNETPSNDVNETSKEPCVTSKMTPSINPDDTSILLLDSSSDDDGISAAGVMNDLALRSVQHRARLLQPIQGSSSTPTSPSTFTNGHFSMSDNIPKPRQSIEPPPKQVINSFFSRFEKADVSLMNSPYL